MPDEFVVTLSWINAHATANRGWCRRQLEQIGVKWPPRKGWKNRAVGKVITSEQKRIFEAFGGGASVALRYESGPDDDYMRAVERDRS